MSVGILAFLILAGGEKTQGEENAQHLEKVPETYEIASVNFRVDPRFIFSARGGIMVFKALLPSFTSDPDRFKNIRADSVRIALFGLQYNPNESLEARFVTKNMSKFEKDPSTGLMRLPYSSTPPMVVYFSTLDNGAFWIANCPEPTTLPFPTCRSKFSPFNGVGMEYNFNPRYLKDWKQLHAKLLGFVTNLKDDAREKEPTNVGQ